MDGDIYGDVCAVEAAALLDDVGRFIRRYVVLSDHQRDAISLWTAASHVPDAFDTAPYLDLTSPLKRCGKSRLLEVEELLVRAPLSVSSISTAALYRAIAAKHPTLLLDEVDAIFSPKAGDKEELRGILNAGWRRSAVALRMGGARMTTLEDFSPFGFKVLAGIGDLPDTIRDRCVLIRLERRTRDERIERFRRRDAEPAGYEIRDRLAEWLEPRSDHVRSLRPELPDELDDRAQDCWEPLLAVADLAGGNWPERARAAALALSTGESREDDTLAVQLLRDVHSVFRANGTQRYRTSDLIAALAEIEESPWGDWNGKTITANALSRLLKPYRIKTMPVWADGQAVRGYKAEQFEDAFLRVLGVRSVREVRRESPSQESPNAPNAPNALSTENGANGDVPLPGDDDFIAYIAEAHRNGHITEAEANERWSLHRLVKPGTRL